MKIYEYQAKDIFKNYGIPVPDGDVAETPEQAKQIAEKLGGKVVVKAQVHIGGRGKAGGVKLAENPDDAYEKTSKILGMEIKDLEVKRVLITRAVDIQSESYVGIVIDRKSKKPVFMVSRAGGIDIEEVARETPEKIYKLAVDPIYGLFPHQARLLAYKLYDDPKIVKDAQKTIMGLYNAFISIDASLAEINPLVVSSDGKVWAVDAKVVLDDNGLLKHPELEKLRDVTPAEEKEIMAKKMGLSYIRLNGDIGCVVNGAGLAMATMDVIKHFGGEPANFLDIGGSSNPEKVKNAMDILFSDKHVKGVWFNIFGGITRCDDVAKGMVEAFKGMNIDLPVVVRLTGTNEIEGKEILKASGLSITPADTMSEGAQKIIHLVRGG